ncbi:hypothetical protein DPMN_006414 [Dreissena polymorpha]|uniref:Uncharacterized protein n=1 Tax=Dreissena polymorpha TaxID=45954 RepID=A0A9D4MVE1_DREPO|nr:hypothetical protein DPMN_006414 [Dreissena polymorpha]
MATSMTRQAQNIIRKNLLTKFHKDRKINVACKVFSMKNAPPPGGHVFQPTGIIFELVQDIIGMNLLAKFHEDWTINVASRVKNAPPLGSHVFQANTNLLTKFHEDWKINVASRVLTRKNVPPPGDHFYEDQTINVASRVKNAPPLGSHVFQANITIFELIQDIIETNLLTKFLWSVHKANVDGARRTTDKRRSQKLTMSTLCSGQQTDQQTGQKQYGHKNVHEKSRMSKKNAPPPGSHVFQPTGIPLRKTAPPIDSHVFQANVTIFELIQDIIEI